MYCNTLKNIFIKTGLPLHLTFFITSKCNYNCKHCFNWKRKSEDELSINEIKIIAKSMNKILWLQVTGGEPFLRDDIDKIIEIFYVYNQVRFVSISTNGSLPKVIKNKTKTILDKCKNSMIRLSISIDGLRGVHDYIREKGSFDKAIKTIKELKQLKTKYKNLNIGIVTTYSYYNQDSIIKFYKEIKKLGADSINLNIIRGVPREDKAKEINIKNYELFNNKLIRGKDLKYSSFRFADLILAQEIMQKDIIKATYTKNKRIMPCYAGNLSSVLYENGDVFPCEMLDEKLGNVKQYDFNFKNLWYSRKVLEIRKRIKNRKCYCTHECNMLINILYNMQNYPRLFQEIIQIKKQN